MPLLNCTYCFKYYFIKLIILICFIFFYINSVKAQNYSKPEFDSIYSKPHHELSFMGTFEKLTQETGNLIIDVPISLDVQLQYSYIYNINKKWAVKTGISIGWHSINYIYPNDFYEKVSTKVFTAAIPINLIYRFRFKPKTVLSPFVGVKINTILAGDFATGAAFKTDTGYIEVFEANYDFDIYPKWGLNFGLNLDKLLKNNNILTIGISTNLNFSKIIKVNYTLYPETEELKSSGSLSGTASYVGIKIGYVFTSRKDK